MDLYQILLIIAAYFIGSIPFAYIIVKLVKKIDIRTVGSGNAGATNAARVLGKWGFISVFLLDALKGFLPVFISLHYYGQTMITLIVAAVVVLGHTYTVFLGFKGGKGVATGAGVFCLMSNWFALKVLTAVIVFFVIFKHRSNIIRIIKGEENKFTRKKKEDE